MNNIEVELRSFLTGERFDELMDFFKKNAEFEKQDNQESYYFDCPEDLRIQRTDNYSKVWLKKGKLHDDAREEVEIKFPRDEFDKLKQLFLALGMNVEIKWFRERNQFRWNDIKVCLDYTKGYGYIIELEKLVSEEEKGDALALLNQKFVELAVELTPKHEFEERFAHYQQNWQELTK